MRGALAAGKRVPSKEALASLEIVKLEDLEENGRSTFHISSIFEHQHNCLLFSGTLKRRVFNISSIFEHLCPSLPISSSNNSLACIICYNEFGVSNPEGLTENPIRLPKCKHVFGDKCIKKWFEDSDSCPYCRDKLPSELSVRKTLAYETYRAARREHMLAHQRARQGFAPRYPFSEESSSSRYAFPYYEQSHISVPSVSGHWELS
jgi:hypothetical protein